MLDKLSLSTQMDVYSPSPLNLPVSKCYAQLPSPNVAAETQLLPFVQRCARSGCSSWLSFATVVIQTHASVRETKLYKNLTYVPLVAHGYRVKLQCQEYMEQRTPDNNIYIYENRDSTH